MIIRKFSENNICVSLVILKKIKLIKKTNALLDYSFNREKIHYTD